MAAVGARDGAFRARFDRASGIDFDLKVDPTNGDSTDALFPKGGYEITIWMDRDPSDVPENASFTAKLYVLVTGRLGTLGDPVGKPFTLEISLDRDFFKSQE